MAIRKRKGRASQYQVYWNNPVTRKRESVSFATLKEARQHDYEIKHRLEFERESFRPEEEEEISTGGTVREIIALYLSAKKLEGINLKNTLYHLRPLITFLGKKEAVDIERRDLLSFIQDQEKQGIKTLTAHRRLSILRAALSWAAENELIEKNPVHGVKVPKGQAAKIPPPTPVEFEKLMQAAPNHLQRALLLAISLGVRVGPTELLSLKWRDVDFARQSIRVWSAKKNRDIPYRDIPIRPDVLESLKAWRAEDEDSGIETIVHFRGEAIQSIKTAWAKCKQEAGITRRLRPYDLRHAFATYALDNDADIKAVADIMGHSDPTMILKHYQHSKEKARRKAVESIHELPSYVPKNMCPKQKGPAQ